MIYGIVQVLARSCEKFLKKLCKFLTTVSVIPSTYMQDALLVGEKKGREVEKFIKRQNMLPKGLCEDVYP